MKKGGTEKSWKPSGELECDTAKRQTVLSQGHKSVRVMSQVCRPCSHFISKAPFIIQVDSSELECELMLGHVEDTVNTCYV